MTPPSCSAPTGAIGHALSYSLLAAPLLYVLWARRAKPRAPPRRQRLAWQLQRDRRVQDARQLAVAEALVERLGVFVADPGRQHHLDRAVAASPRRAPRP